MRTPEGAVITRASKEWLTRPDDQRFLALEDLHQATVGRSRQSRVSTVLNTTFLARGSESARGELFFEHEEAGVLTPTHWSLGQMATISHTPAKWIREISHTPTGPAFAAHAINLGLRHLAKQEKVQLMARGNGGGRAELRCVVGPDYGRIYDHQVVEAVMHVNTDGRWHIPAASYQARNPTRATTLYASDRDVFIFLVDENNPIDVRVNGTLRHLFRGFMVWNSEVGHHRFGFLTFLYDFVCDNRTVWGAHEVKELQIRHTKNAPERFEKEIRPMLRSYAEASAGDVQVQMERAARIQVGKSDEEVLTWLRKHSFTKTEGEKIMEMAKVEEGGARTVWQLANGLTAAARSIPHADDRVEFERRAGVILKVAA